MREHGSPALEDLDQLLGRKRGHRDQGVPYAIGAADRGRLGQSPGDLDAAAIVAVPVLSVVQAGDGFQAQRRLVLESADDQASGVARSENQNRHAPPRSPGKQAARSGPSQRYQGRREQPLPYENAARERGHVFVEEDGARQSQEDDGVGRGETPQLFDRAEAHARVQPQDRIRAQEQRRGGPDPVVAARSRVHKQPERGGKDACRHQTGRVGASQN